MNLVARQNEQDISLEHQTTLQMSGKITTDEASFSLGEILDEIHVAIMISLFFRIPLFGATLMQKYLV